MKAGVRDSSAVKDLAVLFVCSFLVYAFAILFDVFDAMEKWAEGQGLSRLHLQELITILVMMGIATSIFFVRRYREFHEELKERKESETILRESRNKALLQYKELDRLFRQVEVVKNEWEQMMDCAGGMVVLVGVDGKINRCNRVFKDFAGGTYTEIRGKNFTDLMDEMGIDARNLEGRTLEAYSAAKIKWLELKSYTYKDIMTGDIAGAVIVIHDLTELKNIPEALR
ncbi:MAG: PAS domain-containing protein [Deltaproteobacteria bacterium]|nr:PAS domain-containing protein [Deltaproteobacteria bacterium]